MNVTDEELDVWLLLEELGYMVDLLPEVKQKHENGARSGLLRGCQHPHLRSKGPGSAEPYQASIAHPATDATLPGNARILR